MKGGFYFLGNSILPVQYNLGAFKRYWISLDRQFIGKRAPFRPYNCKHILNKKNIWCIPRRSSPVVSKLDCSSRGPDFDPQAEPIIKSIDFFCKEIIDLPRSLRSPSLRFISVPRRARKALRFISYLVVILTW